MCVCIFVCICVYVGVNMYSIHLYYAQSSKGAAPFIQLDDFPACNSL